MAKKPKTLKELSLAELNKKLQLGLGDSKGAVKSLSGLIESLNLSEFKDMLDHVKETTENEKERLRVYKSLRKYLKESNVDRTKEIQHLNSIIIKSQNLLTTEKKRETVHKGVNKALSAGNSLLDRAIKSNQQIFQIAHQMQLESNVTWENYRRLFDSAYETSRKLNKDIGQSVHNVRELIGMQNKMLGTGWRNMDPTTLNNVSASVMTLTKTLRGFSGKFPQELTNAFQLSYRQLGEQTDEFVTQMGNRLNVFSKTFGMNIGILSGAITKMVDSNNFIARSNMNAQVKANESLMKAAALTARVGLTSTDFMTTLAKTAQYGTMEEMAQIYQGGALLQDFDTSGFQQQMINQDYSGATSDLLSSIQKTLGNMDDHYLRAEYMKRIGSTFGLSRDELLRIASQGDQLGEYQEEIEGKLVDVNTSMKDELSGFKMALVDRAENWFEDSKLVQNVGKMMQELGLYGLEGSAKTIIGQLSALIYHNSALNKNIKTGFGGGFGSGGKSLNNLPWKSHATRMGALKAGNLPEAMGMSRGVTGALGLGVGVLGNVGGRAVQANTKLSDPAANWLGGSANVASGALGGAMLGSAIAPGVGTLIGAGLGAGAGLINTLVGKEKREDAMEELEAEKRRKARESTGANYLTEDPVVNAINRQTELLSDVLNSNYEENRRVITLGRTVEATKATIAVD